MTNLQKFSVQNLLNLDNGLTKLFYYAMAGMENGGLEINTLDATQLTDVLSHQQAIQKVLYKKVEKLVESFDFEHDEFEDTQD